jgi:glycosyltransferase involved in cell wall biosynthesis
MKIGIMFSDQSPLIGGGFTFEEGVFSSLIRLKAETKHQLVLISETPERPAFASEFPWLSLKPAPKIEISVRQKILRELGKTFSKKKKNKVKPLVFDFERAPEIAAGALDAIVYLNPFVSPFLDLPYIINVWDLEHRIHPFFPEVSLGGEWKEREYLYREKLQRAAYILVTNECGKKEIVDFYQTPADKIRPLHLPTPEYALRAGEAKPLDHLGIKGEFLFYPAQFWPHKNHMLLLRMLKYLKEKHGYLPQLVLTGADKPLYNYSPQGNLAFIKQRTNELGLADQVIFAGFVSREDIVSLYRMANALVFPSFLGPENIPPLEAFALECPVITAAIPGAEEQYGDAAIQIDPTRPDLWAEAVHELCLNPALRTSLLEKGRIRARKFTSDDFARNLFRIFDEFEPYRCNWPSSLTSTPPHPAG